MFQTEGPTRETAAQGRAAWCDPDVGPCSVLVSSPSLVSTIACPAFAPTTMFPHWGHDNPQVLWRIQRTMPSLEWLRVHHSIVQMKGNWSAAKIFISKIVPSPLLYWYHQIDIAVGLWTLGAWRNIILRLELFLIRYLSTTWFILNS